MVYLGVLYLKGVLISWDYKYSLRGLSPEERKLKIIEVHRRAGERLKRLFQTNQGIYIKAGQHIACLDYLIPPEYIEPMLIFQDKAPHLPFDTIRSMFTEDFGRDVSEIFVEFDEEPIAAASLAQVHRAIILRHGKRQEVAVKIQFPGLRERSYGDVRTIEVIANAIAWLFPEFQLKWLVDEFNKNLPKELDFSHEGRNAERVRLNFETRPEFCIPQVYWDLTTPRILTMEFMHGIKPTNVEELRREGLRPDQVSDLVTRIFCEQIFHHGFVHCDPHPGNLLVRKRNGKPQLVLLDHGLYRELNEEFRLDYSRLWLALISGDEPNVAKYCQKLAGGESYHLLASMLTARAWEGGKTKLAGKMSPAEKNRIRANAQGYMREISSILQKVPSDLLLLFKTNDLLRSLNHELGMGHDSYNTTIRYCQSAINRDRSAKHPGLRTRLTNLKDSTVLEVKLAAFQTVVFLGTYLPFLFPRFAAIAAAT